MLPEPLKYHFEPKRGWLNDPNGLIYYKGRYHAFFQHNPHAPKWDTMHWGHAVSDDLLYWEELPIALYPDMPYENGGGCFSGSAIEKDGRLYLFYTSVSKALGQTQSLAFSDDGLTFHKYEGNPILPCSPLGDNRDFRDPKVFQYGGRYQMVCGAGVDGVGKVLLFESDDLIRWEYAGVLYQNADCSPAIECPDLFELDGQYILSFSIMGDNGKRDFSTAFLIGNYDGRAFTPRSQQPVEQGPDFYAPQTFLDENGRRVIIGWAYNPGRPQPPFPTENAGALSVPRVLTLEEGKLRSFPVESIRPFLVDSDEHVRVRDNRLLLFDGEKIVLDKTFGRIDEVKILRDTKLIEVFVNGGEYNASFWYVQ